jgi:hypothetical protein
MSVKRNENTDGFLEHFGVKGMHWGVRSAVINTARLNQGKLGVQTRKSEKEYLNARKAGGDEKGTLKKLQTDERTEWENKKTAQTLTRGEQIGLGIFASLTLTPVVAAGIIAGTSIYTRDGQKFVSKYPDSLKGK